MASIAIITPTLGRATLSRAIESALPMLQAGDEWFVIGDGEQPEARRMAEAAGDPRVIYFEHADPRSTYGNAQRNQAMHRAQADYFLFLDDDDELLPGALDAVRREAATGMPLMFRMDYRPRGRILWRSKELKRGNVGGAMFVIPNMDGRWVEWRETNVPPFSDFAFITATLEQWPADSLRWCDDIIYLCHNHGEGIAA